MAYDPGRCFWCENMQCDNCNGINEWNNPHASESIGEACKCTGQHAYKIRPQRHPEFDETQEEFEARFEAVRAQMPAGTEPKTMSRKTSNPKRLAAYQAQANLYMRMR